jgi:hypothetical protein
MKTLVQGFSSRSRRAPQMQRVQVWSAEKREFPEKRWLEAKRTGIETCDIRIPLISDFYFK